MGHYRDLIEVADITALKALQAVDLDIRKVTTLDATYAYPSSYYVFNAGATFTENAPGVVADDLATGFWVMIPTPLVLNSGDPAGAADFPGILWVNTTSNARFISNPDLTWSAIAGGSGASTATTTTGYTQPSVGSNVTVNVDDSSMFAVGQYVFIETAGNYEVISKPGPTQLELRNTGQSGNAAPAAAIATSQLVTPSSAPTGFVSAPDVILSADTTLLITDEFIQYFEADTTVRTVNLPAVATATNVSFLVRNIGATHNLTVTDGVLSVTVTPGASTWVHCNGTVWRDIG